MRTLILAAAAAATLIAGPALAKKKAPATAPAAATSTATTTAATPAKAKGTSKMSACAAQWKALGSGQQAYKDKAKGMKSKKGGALSGYNVWTAECMKKTA